MTALTSKDVIEGAPRIGKLVVIGVGLIGGSFALALRAAGCVDTVVGIGRGRPNLAKAIELGIVDRAATLDDEWTAELAGADVVLVAAPVAQFASLFAMLARRLPEKSIVTDAGSTKQNVIADARTHLGSVFPRFVPGHPIAGTEHSGAEAAFPTLFRERNVVLTPLAETDPSGVALIDGLWRSCGARVRTLEPAVHDRIFAAVSHLPHLLAFALVDMLAGRGDAAEFFRYAASGFRDFTRIAAGSPEMWRDISYANRDALLAEVDAYRNQLDRARDLLAAGDAGGLEQMFAQASSARRAWGADVGTGSSVADGARER